MSKTTNRFAREVRGRAVRMVFDHERDHPSRWAAVVSIAEKIGCVPQAEGAVSVLGVAQLPDMVVERATASGGLLAVLTAFAWPRLSAVRNGRVFVADGHHYFHRAGPRLVESAQIIADTLADPDRHEGLGWRRLAAMPA